MTTNETERNPEWCKARIRALEVELQDQIRESLAAALAARDAQWERAIASNEVWNATCGEGEDERCITDDVTADRFIAACHKRIQRKEQDR